MLYLGKDKSSNRSQSSILSRKIMFSLQIAQIGLGPCANDRACETLYKFSKNQLCRVDLKRKNHVFLIGLKPMPKDASRRELSKSVLRIEKGALCVELLSFYCSIRIMVPMSHLFLVQEIWLRGMVNKIRKLFKKVTWYILQGDK